MSIRQLLDHSSPIPLHHQIVQQMQAAIDSGELAPGARLDSEIELAKRAGVSRPTMRRAIATLVDQGRVVRRRGLGTVVLPRRVRRPVALTSLFDDLTAAGRRPSTEVLSLRRGPADAKAAAALELAGSAEAYALRRLRLADDTPIALLHNHVPASLVELSTEALADTGLYELLRRAGISMVTARQTISARAATASEARQLQIRRGATLLTMERTVYDRLGRAVEWGNHCYPVERYSFEMSLSAL